MPTLITGGSGTIYVWLDDTDAQWATSTNSTTSCTTTTSSVFTLWETTSTATGEPLSLQQQFLRRILQEREQVMLEADQQLPQPRRPIPDAERPPQLRDAAVVAARELLLAHLNHSQRRSFRRSRSFVVRGNDTGRRYRIRGGAGLVANIDHLDGERGDTVIACYCAHAEQHLMPWPDHLLAQKLNIEFAERDFLNTANRRAAF